MAANVDEELYPAAVADARYLMRRAFRMIDEEARKLGLDPLENQMLVQLRGASKLTRSVSELSLRLDIPLGLVSRIARQLESRDLLARERSPDDGRVTLVRATSKGRKLVRNVALKARRRFMALREELNDERRRAALHVWANNFGVQINGRRPRAAKGS
jgi:DNA-binding MarR family transcriptional regulator